MAGRIPAEPAHFVVRDQLHELTESVAGTKLSVVVIGMRGVGKTQLAAAYTRAALAGGAYGLIGWIDAETEGTLSEGLAGIAADLDVADPQGDSRLSARRLRDLLNSRTESGLLVFDNATDPDLLYEFLPVHGSTKVVITTTDRDFASLGIPLDLDGYRRTESVRFLRAATGIVDDHGASLVAADLGDLPLALAQAAATIAARRVDYAGYRALLAEPLPGALRPVRGGGYPRSVDKAILLSIEAAERSTGRIELDSAVRRILEISSMLSPAGIARAIFPAGDLTDEALARCVAASALNWSDDGTTVIMHRLVARVIRERADTDADRLRLLDHAYTTIESHLAELNSPEQIWRQRGTARQLIDHITAVRDTEVARLLPRTPGHVPGSSPRGIRADLWIPRAEAVIGQNKQKLDPRQAGYRTGVLPDSESVPLMRDPDVRAAYDGLVRSHESNLRRLSAQPADAIVRFARKIGEGETVRIDHQAGIESFERDLAECERILGSDHPATLCIRNNLAIALVYAGRLCDAIHQFEQGITGHESNGGSDAFGAIRDRHNLAVAYWSADRLVEAIESFERSLVDHERLLGLDHSDTFSARHHLIAAYLSAGRLTGGINLQEQQLTESERVRGLDDPMTRSARHALANSYVLVGRHDEATDLRKRNEDAAQRWWADSPAATRLRAVDAYGMSGHPPQANARPRRRWSRWWKS